MIDHHAGAILTCMAKPIPPNPLKRIRPQSGSSPLVSVEPMADCARSEAPCSAVDQSELLAQAFAANGSVGAAADAVGLSPYQAKAMLRQPEVQAKVQATVDATAARLGITAERIMAELTNIAFGDVRSIATVACGEVVVHDLDKLTPEQASLVAGVKMGKYGPNVQFANKAAAIDKLAKIMGLYIDRTEVSGPDGGAMQITHTSPLNAKIMALIPDDVLEKMVALANGDMIDVTPEAGNV